MTISHSLEHTGIHNCILVLDRNPLISYLLSDLVAERILIGISVVDSGGIAIKESPSELFESNALSVSKVKLIAGQGNHLYSNVQRPTVSLFIRTFASPNPKFSFISGVAKTDLIDWSLAGISFLEGC